MAVPTLIAGAHGTKFKSAPDLSLEFGYPLALSVTAVLDHLLLSPPE